MLIGVERYTGLPLIWQQRSLYSYVLEQATIGDGDSSKTKITWLLPLNYMAREFVWTQDLVDQQLEPILSHLRIKWAIFGTLISMGFILILIALFLLIKAKKIESKRRRIQQKS